MATLLDSLRITRKQGVAIVCTGLFLLAIPNVLSQGPWAHIQAFDKDIFVLVDTFSGSFLLVASGLALAAYTAFAWGWERFRDETNVGAGRLKVFPWWKPFIKYIIPIAVAVILLGGF